MTHAKSQLTQARAEIKTLENRIAQLHGHRKETEQLFEKEKNALKSTIEQDRNNVSIFSKFYDLVELNCFSVCINCFIVSRIAIDVTVIYYVF